MSFMSGNGALPSGEKVFARIGSGVNSQRQKDMHISAYLICISRNV